MNVGERIRDIREKKGLSIRKVAQASDVSPSLISQIETGRVDPSLSTLRKIAIALDVPVFSFVLTGSAEPTRLVRKHERRRVVFPGGGLHYDIIHSDHYKKMAIMIGTLAPGGFTSETLLNHPGEECLLVLSGSMKVDIGGEVMELLEDDSLYFDSTIPHRLFNEHDAPCKFYLIITPPKF